MSSILQTTIVVIFDDPEDARQAVAELRQAGFRDDQVGVAMRGPRTQQGKAPAETTASAADGMGIGLFAGASLGGLAGGTLLGLVSGGIVGGLLGAFIGMGIPEEDARYYQEELEAGRTIVTVQAEERQDEVITLLRCHGGREATPPAVQSGVGALP